MSTVASLPYSRICVLSDRDSIVDLEHSWKALFSESGSNNPFLTWEWHDAWVQTHPEQTPWIIAEFFGDGTLAGLAPFRLSRIGKLTCLEPLVQGSGADEIDLLVHPHADSDLPERLLDAYLHSREWQLCILHSLKTDGILTQSLDRLSASHQLAYANEQREYLPLLRLPASFDQLLAARSPNFRSEVRRRKRVLEREHGPVVLHVAESESEIISALQILFDLHNRRRSQKNGHGMFENERLRQFHIIVARRFATERKSRIYVLYVNERAIAALYGFEFGGRFSFFQSGLDPEYLNWSPGTVLMSEVINDCITRGLAEFDFLRGDERYKSRWTPDGRRTTEIRMGNGTVGYLYFMARAIVHRLRRVKRRVAGKAQP